MNEIDHYISTFPPEVQERLELIRSTIKTAAPDAEEVISYKMPAYKLKGILVYFAGYKNHIGFYPGANGISHFQGRKLISLKTQKVLFNFHILLLYHWI